MRYTSSMIAAVFISLFTFLAMSFLISTPSHYKSIDFDTVEFSKIVDQKPINTNNREPKQEKPVKKIVKQPPTKPKVEVVQPTERPTIEIPTGKAEIHDALLTKNHLPLLKSSNFTEGFLGSGNELICTFPSQPIYPVKALRAKIEGWVKVEFVVNEFGLVSSAKVIDAQPKHVFDNATIRAIHKSKYKPLVIDGKAMKQTAVQVIEFKLSQ